MAAQRSAAVLAHRLTREADADERLARSRCEREREDAARQRLLVESELRMHAAKAVGLEEDAGTVIPLAQEAGASELDRDGLPEALLPSLVPQPREVVVGELHREVPAAVAAAMTGVALRRKRQHLERQSHVPAV